MNRLKEGDKVTVVADGKKLDVCYVATAISGINGVVVEADYEHDYHGSPNSYRVSFDGASSGYWLPESYLELVEETPRE